MNKYLFFSFMMFNAFNCFATEELMQIPQPEFDAKNYAFVLKIKPKSADGDMQAFNMLDAAMRELIDGTRVEPKPNLFALFMNFIKELKEAVAAGMNLFITAETHQESLSEVVQELFIEEVIATEMTPTDGADRIAMGEAQSAMAVPACEQDQVVNKQTLNILVCCGCNNESQVAQYEALKATMEAFVSDLNNQNVSDLEALMLSAYEQVGNMPNSSISLLAE